MGATMTESSFPFIVTSGPRLQRDPAIRTLIRKQAMRDVGMARKKKGNYGRVNMRQLAIQEDTDVQMRSLVGSGSSTGSESPDNTDSSKSTEPTDYEELLPRKQMTRRRARGLTESTHDLLSFAAISLFSNYETARAKFRIDVTDLSILTNFNVSKSTIPILSADPTRLAILLGHKQWSYLQFVPGLYGSSDAITAATNCVLAKVHETLVPHPKCRETVLQLYATALRTLQDAISNEESCLDSDVLCATQLLSLHELLDPSRDTAWSQHIDGSARLVKHRTPKRFKTEFDKALFAAHVGPIVSESLVGNKHCYLEQPEWSELYRTLIDEKDYLTDRSALAVHLRLHTFPLPGLWQDLGDAVNSDRLYDERVIAQLAYRCRVAHQNFTDWMEDYKGHCVRMSLSSPPAQELAMRRELFGAAIECLSIIKRLLATICDKEREKLEVEAQALAHLILDLQKQPSPKHSWLFSGHEVGVAYTIMLTKDQWEGHYTYDSETEMLLASRSRYNTWANTLRMNERS